RAARDLHSFPTRRSSDLGRAPAEGELKETGKMPIDAEEARRMFVAGLQDLQATAAQTRELLERQISRLGDFPKVEARLREHLEADRKSTRLNSSHVKISY